MTASCDRPSQLDRRIPPRVHLEYGEVMEYYPGMHWLSLLLVHRYQPQILQNVSYAHPVCTLKCNSSSSVSDKLFSIRGREVRLLDLLLLQGVHLPGHHLRAREGHRLLLLACLLCLPAARLPHPKRRLEDLESASALLQDCI